MTTEQELEDAVAHWVNKVGMAEIAKAAEKLKPRDVMVSLCEDRQTVMLYLNYDDDAATRTASFTLPSDWVMTSNLTRNFMRGCCDEHARHCACTHRTPSADCRSSFL